MPQDISVVGIDDMFLSAYIDPGISTVRLPLKEMAQTMVSRILFRLSNPQARTEEFTFAPRLVERGSVANLAEPGARQP